MFVLIRLLQCIEHRVFLALRNLPAQCRTATHDPGNPLKQIQPLVHKKPLRLLVGSNQDPLHLRLPQGQPPTCPKPHQNRHAFQGELKV